MNKGAIDVKEKFQEVEKRELIQRIDKLDPAFTGDDSIKQLLGEAFKMGEGYLNAIMEQISQKLTNYPKKTLNLFYKQLTTKEKWKLENNSLIIELGTSLKLVKGENDVRLYRFTAEGYNFRYILDVNFTLLRIFESKDRQRYYNVKIGDETVLKTKEELIDFVYRDRNYSYVKQYDLFNYMSMILNKEQEERGLKIEKMYPATGVFTDFSDKNLVVVYPGVGDLIVKGTNGYQERQIKLCEERGIDLQGDLIEKFAKIVNLDTIPKNIMLITLGHSLISPFFYIAKNILDVFPNFFWLAPAPGSGKTSTLELFYNDLFGTELRNNDDVDSASRLTEMATAHTSALHIDDIDSLLEKVMTFIKGTSTRKGGRHRKSANQDLKVEEVYVSYVGSGNLKKCFAGNQNLAFRDRGIMSDEFKEISNPDKIKKFETLSQEIKRGEICGYYVLKKGIEFIDIMVDGGLPTKIKFERYYSRKRDVIREYIKEEGIELNSGRRLTIYTLLWMGWEMWEFIFNSRDIRCPILKDVLNKTETNVFKELIIKCETEVNLMSMQDIGILLSYIEEQEETWKYRKINGDMVFTNEDLKNFNKMARMSAFNTYNNLGDLAEVITGVTRVKSEPKNMKVRLCGECDRERKNCKDCKQDTRQKWGLLIDYKSLQEKLPEEKENPPEMDNGINVDALFEDLEEYKDSKVRKFTKGDLANLLDHSIFKYEDHAKILSFFDELQIFMEEVRCKAFKYEELIQILQKKDIIPRELLEPVLKYFLEPGIMITTGGKWKFTEKWRGGDINE